MSNNENNEGESKELMFVSLKFFRIAKFETQSTGNKSKNLAISQQVDSKRP